jgi:hypothetical protein
MALITFREYLKENQKLNELAPVLAAAMARAAPVLTRIAPTLAQLAKSPTGKKAGIVTATKKQAAENSPTEQPIEPLQSLNSELLNPPVAKTFTSKNTTPQPQNQIQQSGGSIKSNVAGTFGAAQQTFMRNLYGTGLQGR